MPVKASLPSPEGADAPQAVYIPSLSSNFAKTYDVLDELSTKTPFPLASRLETPVIPNALRPLTALAAVNTVPLLASLIISNAVLTPASVLLAPLTLSPASIPVTVSNKPPDFPLLPLPANKTVSLPPSVMSTETVVCFLSVVPAVRVEIQIIIPPFSL